MRSVLDGICGERTDESTLTTSIAANVAGPAAIVPLAGQKPPVKKQKPKLAALLAPKRELKQEAAGDASVIPDNAELVDGATGEPADDGTPQLDIGGGTLEPKIPVSAALVAPDTTPDAENPLDPSQVPMVSQPAGPPMPSTAAAPQPADNDSDALRTILGAHQESFNPALIAAPGAGMVVEAAELGDVSNSAAAVGSVEDVAAAARAKQISQKLVADAQAGVMSAPPTGRSSMAEAIEFTRSIFRR